MPRRRGGQDRNDNASNVKRGLPPRLVTQISTKGSLRLALSLKLKEELGHEPGEEELRRKVATLAFSALDAYLGS